MTTEDTKHDDGGSAFPQTTAEHIEADGMSLWDDYAGRAMAGLVSSFCSVSSMHQAGEEQEIGFFKVVARTSGALADAMIGEKRRREKSDETAEDSRGRRVGQSGNDNIQDFAGEIGSPPATGARESRPWHDGGRRLCAVRTVWKPVVFPIRFSLKKCPFVFSELQKHLDAIKQPV